MTVSLKMDAPVGTTPLDGPNEVLSKPVDRVDGPLKVTGSAKYSYEYFEGGTPLYAYLVEATIGKGSIADIDTRSAEVAAGVVLVMTHKNAPKQGKKAENKAAPQFVDDRIHHHGQPIALIVANTFEQARAAADLIKVDYVEETGKFDFIKEIPSAIKPKATKAPVDTSVGHFDKAFAEAPVKIDVTYTTPNQSHAMMEPHATLAVWDGDTMTVYTANQLLDLSHTALADTLLLPEDKVRLVSKYIGGGFGAKLHIRADVVLAALASRILNKPVKIALTRPQVFHVTTHRSATLQRLRLAASADGAMSAVGHDAWSSNLPDFEFFESAADQTRSMYAGDNQVTTHRLVALDLPQADSMRAPGEAVGLLALECAMDELAFKLDMDPIAFREKNEPKEDPLRKIPFSTRNLVGCMRAGSKEFGWEKRQSKPGQVRDGRWLVGMGMAAAYRLSTLSASKARVRLDRSGNLTVETAMTDIGTGSYTILGQIAAELLGLPLEKVAVVMGDTNLPKSSGSGGSWGAGSTGSAVYAACMDLREKLAKLAGFAKDASAFKNETITDGAHKIALKDLVKAETLEGDGEFGKENLFEKYSQASYGAFFVELGVDIDSGETRLRRMLGVFSAGRILNPKTARSQAIGGMVFGIGAALTEDLVVDKKLGFFANHDLAEYHVPVHADIPVMEALFLPELDDKSNFLKSKGLGELGISGSGAAIGNAIFNATGVRLRDYPFTLDKLLPSLSENI